MTEAARAQTELKETFEEWMHVDDQMETLMETKNQEEDRRQFFFSKNHMKEDGILE